MYSADPPTPVASPASRRCASTLLSPVSLGTALPPSPAGPGAGAAPEESLAGTRTPIRLFGSARVAPRYQGGVMLGVEVADVQPGSFWERIGVRSGDLIFEANGERIDDPEASIALLRSLEGAQALRIWVRGADGRERYLLYDAPLEEAAPRSGTAPPAAPAPRQRGRAG